MRLFSLTVIAVAVTFTAFAAAQNNQFWLAAQHDWGGNKGFFLTLNGQAPSGGGAATLENVKLELGIGDGVDWRFISVPVRWEYRKLYTAKVVVESDAAEVWLDGQRIERLKANFVAVTQPMAINEQPSFLRGPADYVVHQTRLVARGAGAAIEETFAASSLPPQLLLFNPAAGAARKEFTPGDHCTIETTFQFEQAPKLRELAPFIDRFGQSVQADWPGKVRTDADLKSAQQEEDRRLAEWGEPKHKDRFGGITGAAFSERPNGFFRVTKRGGKWWLITPLGNPCFYVGLCNAPALNWESTPVSGREYLFESLPTAEFSRAWSTNPWQRPEEAGGKYIAFHTANLIRRYGVSDWEKRASASARYRASVLGFSGYGKWAEQESEIPHAPVIYHFDVPNLARHPDVFDPAVCDRFRSSLRKQIEPHKDDPYAIGWSVGNEFDECITAADVVKILGMGKEVPAKRAMIAYAMKEVYGGREDQLRTTWGVAGDASDMLTAKVNPPPADIETLRRFYAGTYYAFIHKTVKSIDPQHLYLGFWVTPNWWENDADWDLMAKNCDVIGYDFYARSFDGGTMHALLDRFDKPAICGEFSCPPDYDAARGYGRYHTYCRSEDEAGQIYASWLADASKHPKCVGVFYFQYRDQPLTGRGPLTGPAGLVVGEDFAFGLVDVTDRLKWPFVERVRTANFAAVSERFK